MYKRQVHLHAPHAEQLKGFTLQQSDELCYLMRLRGDEAVALLQMTPFAWRAKPEVWQALAAKEVFDCQTDFKDVYKRQVEQRSGADDHGLAVRFWWFLRFASDVQMDGITICWRGSDRATA